MKLGFQRCRELRGTRLTARDAEPRARRGDGESGYGGRCSGPAAAHGGSVAQRLGCLRDLRQATAGIPSRRSNASAVPWVAVHYDRRSLAPVAKRGQPGLESIRTSPRGASSVSAGRAAPTLVAIVVALVSTGAARAQSPESELNGYVTLSSGYWKHGLSQSDG